MRLARKYGRFPINHLIISGHKHLRERKLHLTSDNEQHHQEVIPLWLS